MPGKPLQCGLRHLSLDDTPTWSWVGLDGCGEPRALGRGSFSDFRASPALPLILLVPFVKHVESLTPTRWRGSQEGTGATLGTSVSKRSGGSAVFPWPPGLGRGGRLNGPFTLWTCHSPYRKRQSPH